MISFPCERGLCHLSIWLGSIHTGTISYRSIPLRSKKWYGERLHSHWYGKNQPGCYKAGPEIGWYRKVNQKLEQYDIVPSPPRANRKTFECRPTFWTCLVSMGDTKLVSMTTSDPSDVEVEIRPNCTSLILLTVSFFCKADA